MKKQIAVLMAAATAVTTVAPALAHADFNTETEVSANIVSKVKGYLDTKYKNSSANGITVPSGSSVDKAYMNSQYIVLVSLKGYDDVKNAAELKKFESFMESSNINFKPFDESAYRYYKDGAQVEVASGKYMTPLSNIASNYYVVDDANKLSLVLDKFGDKVQVTVTHKGVDKDNMSYRDSKKKYYVSGSVSVDNQATMESLSSLKDDLYKMLDKALNSENKATYIKDVTVTTQKTNSAGLIETTEYKVIEGSKYTNKKADLQKALDDGSTIRTIELKLTSDTKLTLEQYSDVLDLNDVAGEKPITITKDADGSISVNNTQNVLDQVTKIGAEATKNDQEIKVMAPFGDTTVYSVSMDTPEVIQLKDIYTKEGGYTKEGADFVNSIIDAKQGKNNFSFNFRGVTYTLAAPIDFAKSTIDTADKGYKLTFTAKVRNSNDLPMAYDLRFEIYGDNQPDLANIQKDLKGVLNVVAGHFTKLAGSNRYATAIAVSQEQFKPETADSLVIVGGYAQMDGLAAAPLASAKNAPILLADPKTGINEDTMKEIKRACKSLRNRTVYIVGGPHSVPTSVESQLEKEFGAVVVRTYGVDRNATSLAVARRLFYDGQTNGRVFVVGRDGGADAMGVASVASTLKNIDTAQQKSAQYEAQELAMPINGVDVKSKYELAKDLLEKFRAQAYLDTTLSADEQKKLATELENLFFYPSMSNEKVVYKNLVNAINALNKAKEDKKEAKNGEVDANKKYDAELTPLKTAYDAAKKAYDEYANKKEVEAYNVAKAKSDELQKTIDELDKKIDAPTTGSKAMAGENEAAVLAFAGQAPITTFVDGVVAGTKTMSDLSNVKEVVAKDFGTNAMKYLTDLVQKAVYVKQKEAQDKIVNDNTQYVAPYDALKKTMDEAEGKYLVKLKEGKPGTKAYEEALKAFDKAKEELLKAVKAENAAYDTFKKSGIVDTGIKNGKVEVGDLNGRTVSPIIVTNKNSMDRVTRDFIKDALGRVATFTMNKNAVKAYIIGGENSVSANVRKALELATTDVNRLSGSNRYNTNSEVIKHFYTNGMNYFNNQGEWNGLIRVQGAVFTSGDDKYLVDSQTSGFFAASKGYPIVLTDKALTSDQVDMMKKDGVLYNLRNNIYQVGGVVSADVMKNVVQLLGL